MYNIIKTVLETGKFELTEIIRKIDTVWFEGKITDEKKAELVALAQSKANPQYSLDLIAKIEELDKRVKALETQESTPDNEEVTEEYKPFVVGKWYYGGDRISFDDGYYECTAPDGVVCTWSPIEYPAYWTLIE